MITDEDIKNLEKTFTTKKDLQKNVDELIKLITEGFGQILDRLDDYNVESQNNRVVLGDHEKRLQRIEYRSSRSTT